MNSQEYYLNIRPGEGYAQTVKVSQGDIGRPLLFHLMDGANPLTITAGSDVIIHATKPSGLGFTEACSFSGSSVSVSSTLEMTQEFGLFPAEIVISLNDEVLATANFSILVERSPHPDGTTDGTKEELDDLYTEVNQLKEDFNGWDSSTKLALLNAFAHVAWTDEHGQDYYDALEAALYPEEPPATLESISAVYTQSGTVYDTDSLDSLKDDLVVTATYDDSSTAEVTSYTLSGTLTEGTSTITVSYSGKTTTFTVPVTAMYDVLSYVAPSGESYINIGYIPDENTKIVMDYQSDKESGTTFQCPLGATKDTGTSAQDHTFFFYIGSSNALTASVSLNGASKSNIATIAENSRHTYELSNNDISLDSVSYGIPRSTDSEQALSGSVTVPFYVFARNHGDTLTRAYATGKCYELSIYSGNTLVRHYVPRKRNSDNEYGLLDTVNNVFYKGTGTITGV